MSERKFQKYLLYAIGEVLLVVIGILIALSLNNWNGDRKEALKEAVFLEKMLEDLEAQEAEIDDVADKNGRSIHRTVAMLEMMGEDFMVDVKKNAPPSLRKFIEHAISQNSTESVTKEDFGRHLGLLANQRTIDLNQTTHLELLSTGQYNLIKDEELHKAIIYNYSKNQDFLSAQDAQIENLSRLVEFLEKNGIPTINSLSYDQVMSRTLDKETLKATLKNHAFFVARSVSLFYYTAKDRGDELSEKIEAYLAESTK